MRNAIKLLLHTSLGSMGYRVVRVAPEPERASAGLEAFLALLKRLGFAPKRIIDVGANHGRWTREAAGYFPEAEYTLVEPQGELKRHVQDLVEGGRKIRWISAGVAEKAGRASMRISARDDSSTFVLTDRHGKSTGTGEIAVEVTTLNEIVASSGGAAPELVKIDAEGLDLRVLEGASELLGKTEIFLVEAMVCGGYENSAAEVMRFMDEAGYQLLDVTDMNRSPKSGLLWLCELAFLRKGSRLLENATSYE